MVRRIKIFSAADYDCNKIDLFSLQISERCGREEVSILVLDSQIQTECLWWAASPVNHRWPVRHHHPPRCKCLRTAPFRWCWHVQWAYRWRLCCSSLWWVTSRCQPPQLHFRRHRPCSQCRASHCSRCRPSRPSCRWCSRCSREQLPHLSHRWAACFAPTHRQNIKPTNSFFPFYYLLIFCYIRRGLCVHKFWLILFVIVIFATRLCLIDLRTYLLIYLYTCKMPFHENRRCFVVWDCAVF